MILIGIGIILVEHQQSSEKTNTAILEPVNLSDTLYFGNRKIEENSTNK